MGMEPVEFLKLARDLCKQSNNEAALRSAISRGYYALFNLAKQFIEKHVHKLPKGAESHKKVYLYLNHCNLVKVQDIAGDLNDLRDDRNDADYDLSTDKFEDSNVVNLLFAKARASYNDFQDFVSNANNRKKLINGIAEYRKKISPGSPF